MTYKFFCESDDQTAIEFTGLENELYIYATDDVSNPAEQGANTLSVRINYNDLSDLIDCLTAIKSKVIGYGDTLRHEAKETD